MKCFDRSLGVLLVCAVLAGLQPARGSDWPQYGGPGGSGVSSDTGLARAWPVGGPKELWQVNLGVGFGGAAVRDGKVYLLDRVANQQDVLRCLDLATGKEEWRFAYDAPGHLSYDGSRTCPTVDEKFIFIAGPFGHVHCLDRATHQVVWKAHLVRDFARRDDENWLWSSRTQIPKWGESQHPVVYKDLLIFAPQTPATGLVAFEKATGHVRWQSLYVGRNWFSHVTPYLTSFCGVDQAILLANHHPGKDPPADISSVDVNTGKLLWQLTTWKRYNIPIPSPVSVGQDRLFVAGGYTVGCFMLQVMRNGEQWSADYVFKDNDNCTPHIHTPLFYQGCIYANSFDGFHNKTNNGLVCLDLDGRLKWKSGPDVLFDSGGLLIADGLVFILNGRTGELNLAEARPDGYKPLAKAKVLEAHNGLAWAPLALADGKLLVRDQEVMKCLEVR